MKILWSQAAVMAAIMLASTLAPSAEGAACTILRVDIHQLPLTMCSVSSVPSTMSSSAATSSPTTSSHDKNSRSSTGARTHSSTITGQSDATYTSISSVIDGPQLEARTFTWVQVITPTIVGTVQIVVDNVLNRTLTTTKTNAEFVENGTLLRSLYVRSDTNAAGTVTATYPSPVYVE